MTIELEADRPGGVSMVEYGTESTSALRDSTHRFRTR